MNVRLFLALLVAMLPSVSVANAQSDPSQLLAAQITRAIAGDTLDGQVNGMRTPIGYLGASTPDINQRCGREAFERNQALIAQGVLLETDPLYASDERHRTLFYAYTLDGTSIDQTLIAEGLAHAVRTDAAHGADLAAAEADASASGRGCLWAGQ